jgi:hypothetical protein
VPLGDEGAERQSDLPSLALDDLLDVPLDLPEALAETLPVAGRLLTRLQWNLRGSGLEHLTEVYGCDGRRVP